MDTMKGSSDDKLDLVLSANDIDWCARRLLGAVITRNIDGKIIKAKIVETESYDQSDPAAHSYKRTPRSQIMYGPAGRAYIYFIYGMYHCLNVVCGPKGFGAGVLIRAAEPLAGLGNRNDLLNGPGKLCRELRVDMSLKGHDLDYPPLELTLGPQLPAASIVQTKRIGLSKSLHARKRFYIKDSPYISKS